MVPRRYPTSFGEGQLETYLKRQRAGCLLYTQTLIPRGLIGNSGKILGCRALTLLHDHQGHPLRASTHRGDLHLTNGIPQVLSCYEQATEALHLARLVVDREAMAADAPFTAEHEGSHPDHHPQDEPIERT